MAGFGFYAANAGNTAPDYTKPINTSTPLVTQSDIDIASSVDKLIYFGSDVTTQQVQAQSNPGVDQISVTPTDSATGNTNATTRIKLASTQAGLATATAGAAMNIGAAVVGGTPAAIWVRYTWPANENAGTPITYNDLSVVTNALFQLAYP